MASIAFDEDDEEFEDACENVDLSPTSAAAAQLSNSMDLAHAIFEAKTSINLFFNNQIDAAHEMMKPHSNTSFYHALGNSVFLFMEAMLTFEQRHIETASEALKSCLHVCQKFRKKTTISESIGKTFKRSNCSEYTEVEAHAELCFAEALLLKALLTFVEDETLSSMIKGGMKVRTCFNSFKNCNQILVQRKWDNDASKEHFESGVRMGVGTFNLMISLLPGRVIKLLEFIGFSGNKQSGMQDLILGSNMNGLRQVLCVMTLLGYHLIVCYVLSHQEGDLKYCDEILERQLKLFPNGVWFLFFKGRLEFMKGNLDESLQWYKRSWKSQNVWTQFHHICFWEMLWVNSLKLDWREAILYSTFLVENSKWSRTMYTYQKASLMCMLNSKELTSSERRTITSLMQEVPVYKQRIAGKSLPMEKFACRRAERFLITGTLILPAIELMFLWNLFKILGKQFRLAEGVFKIIDRTLTALDEAEADDPMKKFETDNRALLLLMKGACLRHMKSPLQAMKCLEDSIALQKSIKEDTFIIPYAIVEIALVHIDQNRIDLAISCLEDTKKNYTGYSLESRLHFRIHTALSELKMQKEGESEANGET